MRAAAATTASSGPNDWPSFSRQPDSKILRKTMEAPPGLNRGWRFCRFGGVGHRVGDYGGARWRHSRPARSSFLVLSHKGTCTHVERDGGEADSSASCRVSHTPSDTMLSPSSSKAGSVPASVAQAVRARTSNHAPSSAPTTTPNCFGAVRASRSSARPLPSPGQGAHQSRRAQRGHAYVRVRVASATRSGPPDSARRRPRQQRPVLGDEPGVVMMARHASDCTLELRGGTTA